MSTFKFKSPLRLLITLLLLGGIGYGIYTYFSNKEPINVSINSNATKNADKSNSKKSSGATVENRAFNYTPEEPHENGKLKGVVEVGATGFNSFVIKMDEMKRWKIISKQFGYSLIYEQLAKTSDIRKGLQDYISDMINNQGVSTKNIHFVVSSGAQKKPETVTITNELKKMGYVVNLVTPAEEGKLALQCAQPISFQNGSFVADIGSGNTKLSYYDYNNNLVSLEGPGAKYYEDKVDPKDVYKMIQNIAQRVPEKQRVVCFLIGGVPYELAKQVRNGEERYTVLQPPSFYKSDKEKVKAGLNIYQAMVDATNCDTFVFDWDANFTIGFLLQLKY